MTKEIINFLSYINEPENLTLIRDFFISMGYIVIIGFIITLWFYWILYKRR